MAIKTLRVFQEFTSEGYVPMPIAGNIDYGVTIAGTFPGTTPTTFQTDDPDIDVTLTATTDYYVWIRSHGTDWNPMYTRNVRVYPDSPLVNNVVMGIIIANLSNTVPYVGATEDVDLGEFGLTAGYLGLDLTPTATPTTAGTMSWNDADGTANLILKGGNVTLQIGQEQVTRIVNKTGANLLEANYQAVRISGAQGNRLKVDLAQANIDANSADTLGLVTETINNNAEGFITTSGLVRNIDTTGTLQGETWADGDMLYLSGTTAGRVTNIKPQAPTHTVIMGYVVRAHQTQGQIYVKVDNGYELDELHNVKITSVVNKNILVYETATSLWKNRNIFGTQGYVPYYDDTLLMKNSVIYTDGTQVIIGDDEEFSVGNKLSVVGNIAVHKDYGYHSGLYQILFRQDATGEFRIGTNAANDYTTFYANGTERVRISPSGFLGVGVSNPLSILHVKGTTAYTNAIIDNNSASGGGYYSAYQNGAEKAIFGVSGAWLLDNSSDASIIAKGVGQGIQFYTNGSTSEKMGINSDGNVFVGQTPTYVAGATQLVVRGKTGAGFVGVNHYDMSIKGFMNTFNSVFQVGTSTFHSLAFLVEDIERGRVNSSGRLLWGTTTDNGTDLVQINGSLIATSLKKSGGTSSQFLMADGSVTTGVSNQITGTLTTNYIPKANGTNTITNSVIQEIGGIVGIGSTPSNWDYSGTIQLPSGGIFATRGSNNMVIAGALYNSGWKRNTVGFASMFEQNVGGFTWYTAPSGAGLSDITWQQLMNLNPSGRLLINQTTDDGVNLIQANGAIISTAFKKSGGISSQFLKADGSVDSSVYITGITSPMVISALGFTPYNATNPSGFISSNQNITLSGDVSGSGSTSITTTLATITQASSGSFVKITLDTKGRVIGNVAVGSSDIISALGYTPYNSSNPSGYISGITSGMVTTALGYTPVTNARQLTINGTTYDLSADRSWTISGTIGGLTSGYIPKATSASTLGNSLIYDNGSGVGVGTLSPIGRFDVVGSTASSGIFSVNTDTTRVDIQSYNKPLAINRQGNNVLFNEGGGNVGIGTASPDEILTLNRASSLYARIVNTSNSVSTYWGVNGTEIYFGSSSNSPVTFYSNSTERMRLTSGGNLLVGTTTDSGYKLDVNGTGRFSNTLRLEKSIAYGIYGADSFNINVVNTSITTSKAGNIAFTGYSGNGVSPYQYGYISGEKDSAAGDGSYAGSLTFWTTSGGANGEANSAIYKRLTINGAGNLGLGVTPSASSNIVAFDISTIGGVFADGFSQNNQVGISANAYRAGAAQWYYKITSPASYYAQDLGSHKWFSAINGTAGQAISFTQAMTLNASGNLGIGTTSPSDKLTLNSSGSGTGFKITGYQAENFISLNNVLSTGNRTYRLIAGISSVGYEGFSVFDTVANDTRFVIHNTGNVGVNTSADSGYKLDVNGTIRSTSSIRGQVLTLRNDALEEYATASDTVGVVVNYFGYGGSTLYYRNFTVYNGKGSQLFGITGSTGAATFSSSVTASTINAISTLSGASLNISGTQSTFRIASNYTGGGDLLSGTLMYIDDVVNNNLTIIPSAAGTNGSKIVAAAFNGSAWRSMWEFANTNSGNPNLILVKSGGNVLIGTTTDSGYKLDVNGTGRFSSSVSGTIFYSTGATSVNSGLSIEPSGWNGAKHRLSVPISGNISMWSWNWNGSARDYASYGSSNIQLTDNVITFSNGSGNPSEVARFNGTNLLVGTTTDSGYKLDVNGTGRFSGAAVFSSSIQAVTGFFQSANTDSVVDIFTLSNPSSTSSGVRQKFANGYGDLAAIRVSQRDNGALADDGQMQFQVASNSVLDTKMTILNTGNVGIGTASPNLTATGRTTVDINGTSNSLLSLSAGGVNKGYLYADGTSTIYANSIGTFIIQTQGINALTINSSQAATFSSSVSASGNITSGSGINQSVLSSGNILFYNAASSSKYIQLADDASTINAIGFSKSGSSSFTWLPTGNVTIGSSTSMYKFAVNPISNSYFGIGYTGTNTIFVNAVDSGFTSVPIVNNAISHEWLIGFGSAMLLTSSLNLLIGTTTGVSGGGKLQVNGDVNINGNFKINGTVIGGGGGSGITGSGTTNMIAKWTGGTSLGDSALYDNGAYSMGIGTTSIAFPTDRKGLVIRPNGANSGEILLQNSGNTNGSTDGFAIANINGDGVALYNRINAHIRFGTNNTERLRITEDGNLGFGTTSQFGGGVKVIGIANSTTIPNTTPSGGGVLFVQNGALKYMGSNGTYTTIANA